MMKMAVCDDEMEICTTVSRIILQYLKEKKIEGQIKTYECGGDLLASGIEFDIIFLDVDMPGLDGIETAKRLREWDVNSKLIYLTNYSRYQSDAYQVHAFDYLCKPVEKERIRQAMDEAIRYIRSRAVPSSIYFDTKQGRVTLEYDEICYVEYLARELVIHCRNCTYNSASYSLKKVYEKLKERHFEMPHKSYIVNFYHIKRINNYEIIVDNGDTVPLAQKKAVHFKKKFNDFLQSTFDMI